MLLNLSLQVIDSFYETSKQLNFEDETKEFRPPENWKLLLCPELHSDLLQEVYIPREHEFEVHLITVKSNFKNPYQGRKKQQF